MPYHIHSHGIIIYYPAHAIDRINNDSRWHKLERCIISARGGPLPKLTGYAAEKGTFLNIDFRTKGCDIKRPSVQKRVHKGQCQKKKKNEKINKMNQGISRKIRVVDSPLRNLISSSVDINLVRGLHFFLISNLTQISQLLKCFMVSGLKVAY